ncbi:unnamed protein product [Paramecium pentaurelia]|uniref:Uncharacterized protein n=1 Tax=Paramecium pentaurelia TaxID=43138 RepID=A0A8S1XIY6_9CILI|nr:unnamed protein product [Paramecium pentaurelia]
MIVVNSSEQSHSLIQFTVNYSIKLIKGFLFFLYSQFNSFITLKQKYLDIIHSKDLFQHNSLLMCLRIVYKIKHKKKNQNQFIRQHYKIITKIKSNNKSESQKPKFKKKNNLFNLYDRISSIKVSAFTINNLIIQKNNFNFWTLVYQGFNHFILKTRLS